jgi:hypothetical protein
MAGVSTNNRHCFPMMPWLFFLCHDRVKMLCGFPLLKGGRGAFFQKKVQNAHPKFSMFSFVS